MNRFRHRTVFAAAFLLAMAGAFFAGMKFGDHPDGSAGPPGDSTVRIVTNLPEGAEPETKRPGPNGLITEGKRQGESALSVPDIVAKVRSQVGVGSGMTYYATNTMKALAPLAALSEPEIREALDEIEATVTNAQQKTLLYSVLLGRLAETDGPGAIAYAKEHLPSGQGSQGNYAGSVIASILGAWAQEEPEAAWNWFLENREEGNAGKSSRYGQLAAIFSAMGAQDVDAAFARLEDLGENERAQAVTGIARGGAWDPALRERILEHASTLPESARKSLYRSIGYQWAAMDPDGAIEWIENLPPADRKPLVQQAGSLLMTSNPARGAELMVSNATEQELPYTYSRIVSHWAMRDPNAAGDWLNQLPQGPQLDQARSTFARSVTWKDPVSAMEWAKAVENDQQRLQSVRQVYSQWKYRDQPAADAALDGSGLSADQINQIREKASNQGGVKMESTGRVIQVFR